MKLDKVMIKLMILFLLSLALLCGLFYLIIYLLLTFNTEGRIIVTILVLMGLILLFFIKEKPID